MMSERLARIERGIYELAIIESNHGLARRFGAGANDWKRDVKPTATVEAPEPTAFDCCITAILDKHYSDAYRGWQHCWNAAMDAARQELKVAFKAPEGIPDQIFRARRIIDALKVKIND